MKRIWAVFVLGVLSFSGVSFSSLVQAQNALPLWAIDTAKSKLSFEASQQGAMFEGVFQGFGGEIRFDASRPEESTALITIDMRSVDSQSPERDQSLLDKDWFSVESFPESRFEVSKFDKVDENQFIARGELTIRGVKKSIDLPLNIIFSLDEQGRDLATATGEVTLQRLDFGVGQGAWSDTDAVGNPIKVKVSVVAARVENPTP